MEFGTYYINPSDYSGKLKVIELSPRILTYLKSPVFEGGDAETLLKLWAHKIAKSKVRVALNVHGPYARFSTYKNKWEKIIEMLKPLKKAIDHNNGIMVVTFYDRFVDSEDVRTFVKVADALNEMGIKVAIRPTVWYMPHRERHVFLTSFATTINIAKINGVGINLDPTNVFTRLTLSKMNGYEVNPLKDTFKLLKEFAEINEKFKIPQFGRFTPFIISYTKSKPKLLLKKTLPWALRERSALKVELQLAALFNATKGNAYVVYNSTKDKVSVRERVANVEAPKLLKLVALKTPLL